MNAHDRFPGYSEIRGQAHAGDWPGQRRVHEQREIVYQLVTTLFAVWDELQALKVASSEVAKSEPAPTPMEREEER
jgi:hypothetical protein